MGVKSRVFSCTLKYDISTTHDDIDGWISSHGNLQKDAESQHPILKTVLNRHSSASFYGLFLDGLQLHASIGISGKRSEMANST